MVVGQSMIGVAWLAEISPDRAMQVTNEKSSAEYVKTFPYYCADFLNFQTSVFYLVWGNLTSRFDSLFFRRFRVSG